MAEKTHTPGPWTLKFEPPTPDYEYPYMTLRAGVPHDHESSGFEISGIIPEADARLISEAPALLAALKSAVAALRSGAGSEERLNAIRDGSVAIAAADGCAHEQRPHEAPKLVPIDFHFAKGH
jgi:hypothetical protein